MGGCLSKDTSASSRSEPYKASDNKGSAGKSPDRNGEADGASISESSVQVEVKKEEPRKEVPAKPTPLPIQPDNNPPTPVPAPKNPPAPQQPAPSTPNRPAPRPRKALPPVPKVEPVDLAEQENKLSAIFNQIDADKSGTIDVNELKVILEKMSLRVDDENVMFLISRYDFDNNGTLNFEEFCEMILSIMNVKKLFEAYDIDHNGKLSDDEMQGYMDSLNISPEVANQILKLFDEDRSGVVEYSEFVTLVFYLNELEYQYKIFKDRFASDFTWLHAMLGTENASKAPAVAKVLQELKKTKQPFPSLDDFARPIVQAALGPNDPMGRNKRAPRIQVLRVRVRPPPKKMTLRIRKSGNIEQFSHKAGTLYSDPEFPPSANILPPRIRDKVVAWKRPSEMSKNAKLFVNGVEEGDVIQGALGDCWFLGALAVVATSAENFIEHLFVQQKPEEGLYQCKFFKNGKWESVVVDDRLPVDKWDRLVFASCKDSNEFWVPIVEKAYAKLHGSYEAIESGSISDGLKDLTGEGVEVMKLDSDEHKASHGDLGWKALLHNVQESFLMGCAIDNEHTAAETELGCGLLTGHAYSIIDCQEVNGVKLLRLRNPWGQGEWNGPWADNSTEWTPEMMKHFHYEFANDGTFFMNFTDFIKYYSRIYVLRMLSDTVGEVWTKTAFEGEWKGPSAAGCANHAGWLNNPQYALRITQPSTKIFINLSQPDMRYVLKKSPASITKDYDPIGLYILKAKDLVYRKKSSLPDERAATSTITTVRDLSFECTLNQGDYVLIPCTFTPGIELKYGLCLYSSRPVEISELTNVMPSRTLSGAWKGASAGGCANNRDTWMNNPQFLLSCSTPGTVEILLTQDSGGSHHMEAIAIYAFSSPGKTRLREMGMIVVKPSTIINLPTVSETLQVEANANYIIMPTTFEPHKERNFTISVASANATFSVFSVL